MTNKRFEVIKGGLNTPPHISNMNFISGYVTDTRLMGVLGLYIHWRVTASDTSAETDFHQFFYFEAEEFGLEEYQSIKGNDLYTISRTQTALFGGLGGDTIDISQREAFYLVQKFVSFNKEKNIALPGNRDEYFFMVTENLNFSPKERSIITKKICTDIVNDYQAAHYFLMRVFGKDYSAATYLIKGTVFLGLFDDLPLATLCLNTLKELPRKDDACLSEDELSRKTYLAESLIDCGEYYYLAISEVVVDWDHKIVGFQKNSSLKISGAEASLLLRRSEFMTIYSMSISPSRFESECSNITDYALSSLHESGKLYMLLNEHNDHVKKRIFRLSDDVKGLCFVSQYGQILLAAYSIEAIHFLEGQLRKSNIAPALQITAKYEFKEPLLYEFINSGFDDFDEFLDIIREDEDE